MGCYFVRTDREMYKSDNAVMKRMWINNILGYCWYNMVQLLWKTPTLKKGGGFLLFWLGPPQHLHLGTWGAGKKGGVEREEGEGEEASFFFRGFASELKSQALGT